MVSGEIRFEAPVHRAPLLTLHSRTAIAHLKQLEDTNKLCFITDNTWWERDGRQGEFLNVAAGELALRFLQGSGFRCPVLIYCAASIFATRYVLKFSCAGSTVKTSICLAFIKELATGVDPRNCKWYGFRRR